MRNCLPFSEISTNAKWNERLNERTVYPDEVANGYVEEQKLSTEVHNPGFHALDKEMQSPVAMKMACQSRDDHDGLSPSSFCELGIFMPFSHRNIVGLIDARRCPNGVVLIMEWISRSSRHHPGRSSALARDVSAPMRFNTLIAPNIYPSAGLPTGTFDRLGVRAWFGKGTVWRRHTDRMSLQPWPVDRRGLKRREWATWERR
jgi:hypothetical protein